MIQTPKVRVLVVDDSAVVRRMITDVLSKDPAVEVVGTAPDPYAARDLILERNPDVLTLDIDMPRMDGLSFLKVLQQYRPMPVVVISSLTQEGSALALEALELGAVDVLAKPTSAFSVGELAEQLPARIKGAAGARCACRPRKPLGTNVRQRPMVTSPFDPRQLILLGASTGGTEALRSVLEQLPDGLPGICIVQHIPAYFSRAFAERLNACCAFEVREATEGEAVRPGLALVAPGDYHMAVTGPAGRYHVSLRQGPPLHHTRPAVDVLFKTAAECAGAHTVSVLLTGMGYDGAVGMQRLKLAGGRTVAQNEQTCVVYGMPRAAVELGVVDEVLPLEKIPSAILQACCRGRPREVVNHSMP